LAFFDTQPQGAFFFFYKPTFRLAMKGAAGGELRYIRHCRDWLFAPYFTSTSNLDQKNY
jgi:hypothetical protein